MGALSGEATLLVSFLPPILMGVKLLKERICFSRSKFSSLRVDPLLGAFVIQRSKQEVQVKFFAEMAEKQGGVPIHLMNKYGEKRDI